jgi:hypothetical protein
MNEAIILEINEKKDWRGEVQPTLKVLRVHAQGWRERELKNSRNQVVTLKELGRVTVVQPREA